MSHTPAFLAAEILASRSRHATYRKRKRDQVEALRAQVQQLQTELRIERQRPGILVSNEAHRLLTRAAEARSISVAELVEAYAWDL